MKVLLKSAKIIAPGDKVYHTKKRDILVNEGIIQKIAATIQSPKSTKSLNYPICMSL